MKLKLELFYALTKAEEDIRTGRVAPMQETFDDIRSRISEMKNEI